MAEALAYTAAEAAFVLREPVKTIRKALDEGPVEAKLVRKAGSSVRAVEWIDLLYLFAIRNLRDELTPKARNEFYHALKHSRRSDVSEVRFGRLSVALDEFKVEMEQRARDLSALGEKVEFGKDGEALLRGTTIEAHRIAALLGGGMTPEEIRSDYPGLTLEQIETARAYAEAYPKSGRPYPAKTVKKALRAGGLEGLDEVLD